MKKNAWLRIGSLLFAAFVVLSFSNCVTSNTISKQFEKKGYTVGTYTWSDMCTVCPFLGNIPSFDGTSMGYVVANQVYTFAFKCEADAMNSYVNKLKSNGYKEIASGVYALASPDKTYYYKVKVTASIINKESYYIVGFSADAM